MSYRIEYRPRVRRMIASWDLGDILVDVYLRIQDALSQDPAQSLRPWRGPGMVFRFSLIDPRDRLCEHRFRFLVRFSQDEQTLFLVNAGYTRRVGSHSCRPVPA